MPFEGGWSRDTWRSLAEVAELIADQKNGQRRLDKQVKALFTKRGQQNAWLARE